MYSGPTRYHNILAPVAAPVLGTINAINGAAQCNNGGYDVQPGVTARVKA